LPERMHVEAGQPIAGEDIKAWQAEHCVFRRDECLAQNKTGAQIRK